MLLILQISIEAHNVPREVAPIVTLWEGEVRSIPTGWWCSFIVMLVLGSIAASVLVDNRVLIGLVQWLAVQVDRYYTTVLDKSMECHQEDRSGALEEISCILGPLSWLWCMD
jgi:hypothetical protein